MLWIKMLKEKMKEFENDNAGLGIVETILILVVVIAIVLLFKTQIMAIIQNAFSSITHDSGSIIN